MDFGSLGSLGRALCRTSLARLLRVCLRNAAPEAMVCQQMLVSLVQQSWVGGVCLVLLQSAEAGGYCVLALCRTVGLATSSASDEVCLCQTFGLDCATQLLSSRAARGRWDAAHTAAPASVSVHVILCRVCGALARCSCYEQEHAHARAWDAASALAVPLAFGIVVNAYPSGQGSCHLPRYDLSSHVRETCRTDAINGGS